MLGQIVEKIVHQIVQRPFVDLADLRCRSGDRDISRVCWQDTNSLPQMPFSLNLLGQSLHLGLSGR